MTEQRKTRNCLTRIQIKQLKADSRNGISQKIIAEKYNVHPTTVSRYVGKRTKLKRSNGTLCSIEELKSYLDGLREGRFLALNGDMTEIQLKYLEGWDDCAAAVLKKIGRVS